MNVFRQRPPFTILLTSIFLYVVGSLLLPYQVGRLSQDISLAASERANLAIMLNINYFVSAILIGIMILSQQAARKHRKRLYTIGKWVTGGLYLLWLLTLTSFLIGSLSGLTWIIPFILAVLTGVLLGNALQYLVNYIRWQGNTRSQLYIELDSEGISIDYPWGKPTASVKWGDVSYLDIPDGHTGKILLATPHNTYSIARNWIRYKDFVELKQSLGDIQESILSSH